MLVYRCKCDDVSTLSQDQEYSPTFAYVMSYTLLGEHEGIHVRNHPTLPKQHSVVTVLRFGEVSDGFNVPLEILEVSTGRSHQTLGSSSYNGRPRSPLKMATCV